MSANCSKELMLIAKEVVESALALEGCKDITPFINLQFSDGVPLDFYLGKETNHKGIFQYCPYEIISHYYGVKNDS